MVRRYRANDQASTTLNGSVTAGDTTWTVADGSVFPSEGDFFVVCESEIALCTARSTNDLTVTRAQSNTTANSHSSGKTVRGIITKDDILGRLRENNMLRTLPYGLIQDSSGSILTASDFALVNGSSSSIIDGQDGTIEFRVRNHSGDDVTGCTRTFSSADGNLDFYAHVAVGHMDTDPSSAATGVHRGFGIGTRMTSGGSIRGVNFYPGKAIEAQDRSTFLASPAVLAAHGAEGRSDAWIRLTVEWDYSASNERMRAYYSWDSIHWVQLHEWTWASSGLEIGMWASNHGQAGWPFFLDHWTEQAL